MPRGMITSTERSPTASSAHPASAAPSGIAADERANTAPKTLPRSRSGVLSRIRAKIRGLRGPLESPVRARAATPKMSGGVTTSAKSGRDIPKSPQTSAALLDSRWPTAA